MRRRTHLNLALLATAGLLAAGLLLTGNGRDPAADSTISTTEAHEIDRITIHRHVRQDLQFRRSGREWRMHSPHDGEANPARIDAMLALLGSAADPRLDARRHDPAGFGLDRPAVTLVLNDLEFRFGGVNPLERRRYLLFGDNIHLVPDTLYHQLTQPAGFFLKDRPE